MKKFFSLFNLFLILISLVYSQYAYANNCEIDTIKKIQYELNLPKSLGKPLPLASHWRLEKYPRGFDPQYQINLIKTGNYILPGFFLPSPEDKRFKANYYEESMKWFAQKKLPISFISTQWERLLTDQPSYFNLPINDNPNVVNRKGEVLKKVSPFSPVEHWKQVGYQWMSQDIVKKIQSWYPDPPFVLMLSNNEHKKLKITELKQSIRFAQNKAFQFQGKRKNRKMLHQAWKTRYQAMFAGMKDAFNTPEWKNNSHFVGYNAFRSPAFGKSYGWLRSSLYTPGKLNPWADIWDGASASYYVRPYNESTDYKLYSPQIEAMNQVFILDETYQINPDFWFELSTWDGDKKQRKLYKQQGQKFTPDRYAAMVKFGMWLFRPRVVRDFREWRSMDGLIAAFEAEQYFKKIIANVNEVHNTDVLRQFWRDSELVSNNDRKHLYNKNIPEEYKNINRWFLLDTSAKGENNEVPVFSLALVKNKKPRRQWLIYAYSPLGDKKNINIKLPDYGEIQVNVDSSGGYFLLNESSKKIEVIKTQSRWC